MATVPVVIDGVFYPSGKSADDQPIKGTMVGNAFIQGLSVGGGPIIPDTPPVIPPGGGKPPIPIFPIWGPPGIDFPGIPGYPPVAGHPLPIPPPPIDPGKPGGPIAGWDLKTAWTPTTGWIVVLVPDEALVPTPSKK